MSEERKSLQASATFNFENTSDSESKRLVLLPGIFNTDKIEAIDHPAAGAEDAGWVEYRVRRTSTESLRQANYVADQVADDYVEGCEDAVKVTSTDLCKYADFRRSIDLKGSAVTEIVIQNKTADASLFDQMLEVHKTAIGARGGSDFIRLQDYVLPSNYDRSKITIDFSKISSILSLDAFSFLAITVPAGAQFSIQFKLG